MSSISGPKPPAHLSKEARTWWSQIVAGWVLGEQDIKILTEAATSWDRSEQARKVLAKRGLTFPDRFGQPRPRPEVDIEHRHRALFARLVRELNLDTEVPGPIGRPPGGKKR